MAINRKRSIARSNLISQIISMSEKKYGEGTTTLLSSKKIQSLVTKCISTGSPELDRILAKDENGNFGMPVGRIVGISGKEACGKTTLSTMLLKECQKMGGLSVLIETEHAFDPEYAKLLGLNLDELIFSQPDYLEQGLDLITDFATQFREAREEHMATTDEEWDVPMVIVFDSIAGIPPKAELEADSHLDEVAMALHARKLSRFFRVISGKISKEQICLICTNQTKTDTNIKYGSKDSEIGGRALKFHASVRLQMRQKGFIKKTKDGDPIGIETYIKTVKNKVMPPYKEVVIPIIFGKGIDYYKSLFNLLKRKKIISQKGAVYSLTLKVKGEKKKIGARGQDKFIRILEQNMENEAFKKKLFRKIKKSL